MRVILHIGSQKTGTTALQLAFSQAAPSLARLGVLYPRGHGRDTTHAILLHGLYRPDDIPRAERARPKTDADRRRFLDRLAGRIRDERPACVVLSSEYFFRPLDDAALARLRDELLALGAERIEVVVYLRSPSGKFLSTLQQKLKASARPPVPAACNYRKVLEPYARVFGTGAVRASCFDRRTLVDGDIVADFCAHHLGAQGPAISALIRQVRTNESLSAEAIDVLRRHRADFHPGAEDRFRRDTHALIRELLRLDAALGLGRPRLRADVADAIDHAANDPVWLRDTFGLTLPGLDWNRLAQATGAEIWTGDRPPHLADLIEIDPAARRRLLTALADSSWVRRPGLLARLSMLIGRSPGRAGWVRGLLALGDPRDLG